MGYLSTAEVTAILALKLASTDERRVAWLAAGDDQAICIEQASSDIDACLWKGKVEDPDGQAAMWPRVWDVARHPSSNSIITGQEMYILPGGEMDLPSGISSWTVASIPTGIRVAVAIQAAARALRARGYDMTAQHLAAAHAGITAKSSGSGSVSLGNRARSCWANLDRDALAAAMEFARVSGGLA